MQVDFVLKIAYKDKNINREIKMKIYTYIAFIVTFLVATNTFAASLDISPTRNMPNSFQLAEAVFLPDYVEKDFNFEKNPQTGNCDGYRFDYSNCLAPRVPSGACPYDATKFKYCGCDSAKFKYNAENCRYQAETPYFSNANRLLAGEFCQTSESSQLMASECNCKYFRYTTDASCGDAEKIIDERSACQENDGQIRYENCKCNPQLYPYSFKGQLRSQAFLDEVAKYCGNENNFLTCQNYGEEIAFKCAVDTKYKYDSYSCKTENPAYEVSGDRINFYNGHGNDITLYTECNCPSTYSSNCNGAYGSQFYAQGGKSLECRRKSPQCQMGFFQGLTDKGLANCYDNIHGSVIRVAETCIKRDGTKVYRCECSGQGNWDFSGSFCGTCVQNSDHIVCLENGTEVASSCLNQI